MDRITLTYLGLTLSLAAGGLILISSLSIQRRVFAGGLIGAFLLIILAAAALLFAVRGFAVLRLLAWGVFLVFPVYLAGLLVLLLPDHLGASYFLVGLLVLEAVVALDALVLEPRWLEVTRTTLRSEKVDRPLTIALLADIQTNKPGAYEARALALAAAEEPDLVLFAGDYLQLKTPEGYWSAAEHLNRMIGEAELDPPLGAFAVRGNVDWNGWSKIFQGLPVTTLEESTRLDLGPVVLTGLGWQESLKTGFTLPAEEKYHIVLGHSPNFSLGAVEADLLLAGHTHGGQVQVPGIGPIFTLSAVPRSWASGLTEIAPDRYLKVSRGIGMERGSAPRMRFFCRPELVILEIVPHE